MFSKSSLHVTISVTGFNNFDKTDSKKNEEYLHDRDKILYWKYMLSISWFINDLYCWICSSYIVYKKLIKFFKN